MTMDKRFLGAASVQLTQFTDQQHQDADRTQKPSGRLRHPGRAKAAGLGARDASARSEICWRADPSRAEEQLEILGCRGHQNASNQDRGSEKLGEASGVTRSGCKTGDACITRPSRDPEAYEGVPVVECQNNR